MTERWRLDKIITAFSDAAVDPMQWQNVVETASQATGCFGATLLPLSGAMPQSPATRSLEKAYDSYVSGGWIARDDRFLGLNTLLRRGVLTDFDIVSESQIRRRPYYQELLAPHGLRWFAGVKVACGDVQWGLCLQRTIAQGPFSPEEQNRLVGLSNTLSSAAALVRALGFARADGALAAFEMSGTAVAMLNFSGNVIRLNATAEKLIGTDLNLRQGRLTSRSAKATAMLNRALHVLLWSSASVALLPPVVLPRANGRPILAYPARLSEVTSDIMGLCQGLLILVDLEARPRPPEMALRGAFGLTEAESRIAMRIAAGETLDDCAAQLNVTRETARHHLKSIFAKTNTHRQPELVALLARLLRNGDG
jgi:DNA-binding CsgD family transcriptional regulator